MFNILIDLLYHMLKCENNFVNLLILDLEVEYQRTTKYYSHFKLLEWRLLMMFVVAAIAVTNRNLLGFVLTTAVHGNSNIKDMYTSSSYKGFVMDKF